MTLWRIARLPGHGVSRTPVDAPPVENAEFHVDWSTPASDDGALPVCTDGVMFHAVEGGATLRLPEMVGVAGIVVVDDATVVDVVDVVDVELVLVAPPP